VLGDASNRDVGRFVVAVALVDGARRGLEQRREEVGREDRLQAVEYRQDAFEAGTGVDVLLRQFAQRSVGAAVVLREDQIPKFDESILTTALGSAVGPKRAPLSKKISELDRTVRSVHLQKLSSPRRWMRLAGTPMRSRQSSSAWSSEVCTVTQRRSGPGRNPR